jgi:hypothetical protein
VAGATLSTLSDILRDHYIEDGITFSVLKEWTCSMHERPKRAEYELVCLSGLPCDYPDDCPHAEQVVSYPGCPECKSSEWVDVLDEEGDNIMEVRMHRGLKGFMNEPLLMTLLRDDA